MRGEERGDEKGEPEYELFDPRMQVWGTNQRYYHARAFGLSEGYSRVRF
jgi:hypothetical protein